MEKINIHNYEAFFLDFAEGNLTEQQIVELNSFLNENPGLRSELEAFEIVELPDPQSQTHAWNSLKKPNTNDLKQDSQLRDAFFLRAIENQLTGPETEILNTLLQDEKLKKEFALWQKVILLSGNEKIDKNALYHFGLDRSISEINYEYFLIALGEGLLSKSQILELEKFAGTRPGGLRELEMSHNLKLTPPKGIFYPDKAGLYKKEKKGVLIWLYRAAAVAAVLLLGVFIWTAANNTFPDKAPMAQDDKPAIVNTEGIDSTSTREKSRDSLQNVQKPEQPALEEWEIREPDDVNYADAQEQTKKPSTTDQPAMKEKKKNQPVVRPEIIEPVQAENLTTLTEIKPVIIETTMTEDAGTDLNSESGSMSTSKTFHSVPAYAEDLMAQKLNIPDSEKDEMAMILAKRFTSKASDLLDAEYTKTETGTEGDESLTYTLRIGSFKVRRTKTK